jgi:hypothetical protein
MKQRWVKYFTPHQGYLQETLMSRIPRAGFIYPAQTPSLRHPDACRVFLQLARGQLNYRHSEPPLLPIRVICKKPWWVGLDTCTGFLFILQQTPSNRHPDACQDLWQLAIVSRIPNKLFHRSATNFFPLLMILLTWKSSGRSFIIWIEGSLRLTYDQTGVLKLFVCVKS